MKLNTKLIAVIFIFLMINSNVLAFRESLSLSRFKQEKIITGPPGPHLKSNQGPPGPHMSTNQGYIQQKNIPAEEGCPGETDFDIIRFIYGFVMTISGSIEDDISEFFHGMVGTGKKVDQCFETLGKAFITKLNAEEKKLKDLTNQLMSDKEKENKIAYLKKVLKGKEKEIEKFKSNPKELCKLMAQAEELKKEAQEELERIAQDMTFLLNDKSKTKLDDYNPNKSTLEKICNLNLHDIMIPIDAKKKLYRLLVLNSKTPGLSFDQVKANTKKFIDMYPTNSDISKTNYSFLDKCDDLPNEDNHNMRCYQVGVFKHVSVLWDLLTSTKTKDDKDQIKACFKHFIIDSIFVEIISVATDKLIELIKKVFSYMFLQGIKSLYYGVRLLITFITATKTKDISEKSELFGQSAAYAVKMLMSSLCIDKKRKLKMLKLKKLK
jgi:hypothetical protein